MRYTFVQGDNSEDSTTHSSHTAFEDIMDRDGNAENDASNRGIVKGIGFYVNHREIMNNRMIKIQN